MCDYNISCGSSPHPSTKIVSGAPYLTSVSRTNLTGPLFRPIRVVSFPSLHVPCACNDLSSRKNQTSETKQTNKE